MIRVTDEERARVAGDAARVRLSTSDLVRTLLGLPNRARKTGPAESEAPHVAPAEGPPGDAHTPDT
jgi:hypothetical protein